VTTCCGLEVQNPIQGLKSVKGPRNTFEFNTKLGRTLPMGILQEIFNEPVLNFEVKILHPAVGLMCRIPPRHLRHLKARAIPLA
jgi:hypothetical protein